MILDEIVAHKRAEVAARKAMRSPAAVAVERAGPAAVLLIAAILDGAQLRRFLDEVRRRGMDALVEVHTPDEVAAAVDAGADLIGINNRDLNTLHVDLQTTARLRPLIPPGVVVVSE